MRHHVSNVPKTPLTTAEWRTVSAAFHRQWNFPHCLGAIDGKHILLTKPWHVSSQYHNYMVITRDGVRSAHGSLWCQLQIKFLYYICHHFGTAMWQLIWHCRFTYIDVGSEGRCSDGGVFSNTSLLKLVEVSSFYLPEPRTPPNGDDTLPYVFVGMKLLTQNTFWQYNQTYHGWTVYILRHCVS